MNSNIEYIDRDLGSREDGVRVRHGLHTRERNRSIKFRPDTFKIIYDKWWDWKSKRLEKNSKFLASQVNDLEKFVNTANVTIYGEHNIEKVKRQITRLKDQIELNDIQRETRYYPVKLKLLKVAEHAKVAIEEKWYDMVVRPLKKAGYYRDNLVAAADATQRTAPMPTQANPTSSSNTPLGNNDEDLAQKADEWLSRQFQTPVQPERDFSSLTGADAMPTSTPIGNTPEEVREQIDDMIKQKMGVSQEVVPSPEKETFTSIPSTPSFMDSQPSGSDTVVVPEREESPMTTTFEVPGYTEEPSNFMGDSSLGTHTVGASVGISSDFLEEYKRRLQKQADEARRIEEESAKEKARIQAEYERAEREREERERQLAAEEAKKERLLSTVDQILRDKERQLQERAQQTKQEVNQYRREMEDRISMSNAEAERVASAQQSAAQTNQAIEDFLTTLEHPVEMGTQVTNGGGRRR